MSKQKRGTAGRKGEAATAGNKSNGSAITPGRKGPGLEDSQQMPQKKTRGGTGSRGRR